MKRVLIVLGGKMLISELIKLYSEFKPDCVIAADGALKTVSESGINCDYGVGDFDTVSEDILEMYRNNHLTKLIPYPPEKNLTDSEIALQLAVDMKPDHICITGATGGRMDHFLANIEILRIPYENSIFCEIADSQNRIFMFSGRRTISKMEGWKYVSFIPYSDKIEGLTLEGFKYPLKNRTLKKGSTLCISNELTAENGIVYSDNGILLCVRSKD